MNSNDLFDVIGEVKDEWILDAKAVLGKKSRFSFFHNKTFRTIAACFAVFFVLTGLIYGNGLHFAGGSGADSRVTGHDPGTDYMNYFGPVFPLTLLEEKDFVSAERKINYDFSIYSNQEEVSKGANITDCYQLYNNSSESVKIQAVYPVVGTLASNHASPTISMNGIETNYEIYCGGETEYSLWRMYKYLFVDDHYLESAMDSSVCYNQKVIVYELDGFLDKEDDYLAQTLYFNYKHNPSNSKIMAWGFNGAGSYPETSGSYYVDFMIKDGYTETNKKTKYLVVIGDDLESYSITTRENKEWKADSNLKDRSASITRMEMEIVDAVDMILKEELKVKPFNENVIPYENIDYKQFKHVVMKEVDSFIGEKKSSVSYDKRFAWLDSIFHKQYNGERVFYLLFDMEIPPEASVDVSIDYFKQASNSYSYHGSQNEGIDGYELVTKLGSNLSFIEQGASISGFESVEIIRQNFGFAPEKDITDVKLDMEEECYYIEVRNKERTVEESVQISYAFIGFWPIFLFLFTLIALLLLVVKMMDKVIPSNKR